MIGRSLLVAAVCSAFLWSGLTTAAAARGPEKAITGVVTAAGLPLEDAYVELFSSGFGVARLISADTTDVNGMFSVNYRRCSPRDLLYVVVSEGAPGESKLVLVAILGQVGKNLSTNVVVNELTTVAAAFACAQFIDGDEIYGFSPGLDNSFATTTNLVDVQTGTAAAVISNYNNGTTLSVYPRSTEALLYFNTLADMIVACAADNSGAACDLLFALTTPADSPAPTNTFEAIHNIARNPAEFDSAALLALAETAPLYDPLLTDPPTAWVLTLHFTEGGFNAPGRIAFDSKGNVWSNNNFSGSPPTVTPANQVSVLGPLGQPILNSPIIDSHVNGSGYGTAVDMFDNGWISNFVDGGITSFSPKGKQRVYIPASAYHTNPPVVAMGMAFDQHGNLWVTNMGDSTEPLDAGSITVFLKANRNRALTFPEGTNDGSVVRKPFSVAIDWRGRAWVANSGFAPLHVGGVAVLELTRHGKFKVIAQVDSHALSESPDLTLLRKHGDFSSPKTIAIDQGGNGWISNFESNMVTFIDGKSFDATDYEADPTSHNWGMAVDGSGQLWIASFTNPPSDAMTPPVISVMQGTDSDRGEFLFSFSNPSMQHITGLQIDASGNVWICNNWDLATTPSQIIGGDGLVQFIGVATPVNTPLIGPPTTAEFFHPRFGFRNFGPSKWFSFGW
ncbi:hypothetical protein LOC68_25320 [Blastopirellula sp. JC732]|uniref:SMP-30/Gluconolactonase/LRE-like region domain-containing protein n=1 Tax=Blastopirellula sediminis TaxID=2894196 RepID=A0A9X1MSR7_9BACT|nr:hypothetical protein [Blastopirellula sediminis]MCC9604970.1 hypothetical protein [Blastopirellula sediminis]MCC9631730.1 hypothetical protein [Blastopirellula sediminis]